jgi:hypothetical protein
VTRGTTIVNQCKVPWSTPWVPPGLEFLFNAPLKPLQTPIPHPVLAYIVGEMEKNAGSDAVKKIRKLNETHVYEDALKEYNKSSFLWQLFVGGQMLRSATEIDMNNAMSAMLKWACQVADARVSDLGCGEWDHKPHIRANWGVSQLINFRPIGKEEQIGFFYDIWSNIHYGYVGRAAGFTERDLVNWAATENIISNLGGDEPASDRRCIEIGSQLYAEGTLGLLELLRKLYDNKGTLHRYDPTRPQEKRVYTEDQ